MVCRYDKDKWMRQQGNNEKLTQDIAETEYAERQQQRQSGLRPSVADAEASMRRMAAIVPTRWFSSIRSKPHTKQNVMAMH